MAKTKPTAGGRAQGAIGGKSSSGGAKSVAANKNGGTGRRASSAKK